MSRRNSPDPGLEALGVPAEPGSVYELALTHRSFAFEQPEITEHNERLEFLGDAILGAIITDLIYRRYPALAEGEMARLRASVVSTGALAQLASSLGVGGYLRLGKGEEASGGRTKPSLLADTFEALIGATYLDRGIEAVAEALTTWFAERLQTVVADGGGHDPKTALQEFVVRDKGARPAYRVASSGPDHDKRFTAHVYVDDELLGVGSGRSKKEAEQCAAREALTRLDGARLAPVEVSPSNRPERGSGARAS